MGEVDAVIPESALNGDVNGLHKSANKKTGETAEPMDVDTEEESQVSSENGASEASENHNNSNSKQPAISKESESLNTDAASNANSKSQSVHSEDEEEDDGEEEEEENSKQNEETEDDMSRDRQSNNGPETEAENSQGGTTTNDENSQFDGADDPKEDLSSRDNEVTAVDTDDGDETTNDNSTQPNPLDEENSQSSQNSRNSTSNLKAASNGVGASAADGSKKSGAEDDEDSQSSECKETTTNSREHVAKENGGVNGSSETKVVVADTDDVTIIESDEEEDPLATTNVNPPASGFTIASVQSNAPLAKSQGNDKKASVDDDAPVVIPSDSESEDDAAKQKSSKSQPDEDMSGDDCVVIEDDDKKDTSSNQRKSGVRSRQDGGGAGDDELPPTKKARTSASPAVAAQPGYLQVGQITIKDPRSLMQFADPALSKTFQQQFAQAVGVVATKGGLTGSAPTPQGILPNNIRPGLAPLSMPPKLVPTSPATTLPVSNPNLLPALTDDMFVLEAPSFIVPYIYEKPPSDSLKDIVTKLEAELAKIKAETKSSNKEESESMKNDDPISLDSKQDDESTQDSKKEQNNDKSKKKKKQKGDPNQDDSWDEGDASTDDEASDGEPRTKVLIKDAKSDLETINAVLSTDPTKTPTTGAVDKKNDPKSENYFESPLGKFFMDIGVNLVQEYVQTDLLRSQKRKLSKSMKSATAETELAIRNLQKNIETSKKKNEPYRFDLKRCEFCNFKSESGLAMAHHYETPHMRQYLYKCNFCIYETRPAHDILFHMEAVHNIKGRLEKSLAYNQCPNCPFEENGKAKFARHIPVCAKKFRPEVNLQPPHDWEAPAKIPRIKPRHGLVGTATAYQAMAAQAAAQKAQLAALAARATAPVVPPAPKNRGGRPPNTPRTPTNVAAGGRGNAPTRPQIPVVLPTGYQISPGGQIIQIAGSNLAVLPNAHTLALQQAAAAAQQQNSKKNSGQQPSISITPLPRPSANASQAALAAAAAMPSKPPSAPAGMKPGQAPTGGKASFVICEICDGYIKDLEQLRNHMQWMHKVKIHPKMIHNRPPLNCQKCQFRFFTDQGLERHLLGSHGLVTSSMQEAANKGKDAGRCPVCGRMYQWKLLNHVSRDHHMTLKPAHLSYKCTVCTATFGMYKQFENHVYTAHSTVAKKAMDGKKNNNSSSGNNSHSMAGSSSSGGTSGITISSVTGASSKSSNHGSSSGLSFSAANDSLLKPLKMNDEITIIPQPSSRSRASLGNNYESHLIGKSSRR